MIFSFSFLLPEGIEKNLPAGGEEGLELTCSQFFGCVMAAAAVNGLFANNHDPVDSRKKKADAFAAFSEKVPPPYRCTGITAKPKKSRLSVNRLP